MLNKLLDESNIKKIKENTLIEGVVFSLNKNFILLDINFKSETKINLSEYNEEEQKNLKIGDKITVLLEEIENKYGETIVSYKKAKIKKKIEDLENKFNNNEFIQGIIKNKVKGGYEIDLNDIKGFLPYSLIDINDINMNQITKFKIIKFDKEKNNIVLTKKFAIEKTEKPKISFNNFVVDQKVRGKVKNLTDYGAFINLGNNIDGLVHITDISWRRIKHPKDVLKVNDEIDLIVLKIDEKENKIYLGIKQLTKDPWNELYEKYPKGTKLLGKITNFTNYGIFIEIEKGIEGLLHNSYLKNAKINKESLKTDQIIEVKIQLIDPKNKKLSLNIEKKNNE